MKGMRSPLKVDSPHDEYVDQVLHQISSRLGEDLVSVVLFGSYARGDPHEGSDVDLLVVCDTFKELLGSRFEIFNEIERALVASEARMRLRKKGLGTLISPLPLTPDEVKRNPPILLDILTDGIILYDRNAFMRSHLRGLELRLKQLEARKVYLPSGKWFWDLKPDYKLGDEVEI